MSRKLLILLGGFFLLLATTAGNCNKENTITGPGATPTPAPTTVPTNTPVPATPTLSGPTHTPAPATLTPTAAPPTATPTPAPPTPTHPSATPTAAPPTSTPTPAPPTPTPPPGAPMVDSVFGQRDPVHPGDKIDFFGTNFDTSGTYTLQQSHVVKTTLINPVSCGPGCIEVTVPANPAVGAFVGCVTMPAGTGCGPQTINVVNP